MITVQIYKFLKIQQVCGKVYKVVNTATKTFRTKLSGEAVLKIKMFKQQYCSQNFNLECLKKILHIYEKVYNIGNPATKVIFRTFRVKVDDNCFKITYTSAEYFQAMITVQIQTKVKSIYQLATKEFNKYYKKLKSKNRAIKKFLIIQTFYGRVQKVGNATTRTHNKN